jgi:hypothetical protein
MFIFSYCKSLLHSFPLFKEKYLLDFLAYAIFLAKFLKKGGKRDALYKGIVYLFCSSSPFGFPFPGSAQAAFLFLRPYGFPKRAEDKCLGLSGTRESNNGVSKWENS